MLALRKKIFGEIHAHVAPQMGYLDVIRDVLPDDGIFVDEITQVGFVSWYLMRRRSAVDGGDKTCH